MQLSRGKPTSSAVEIQPLPEKILRPWSKELIGMKRKMQLLSFTELSKELMMLSLIAATLSLAMMMLSMFSHQPTVTLMWEKH